MNNAEGSYPGEADHFRLEEHFLNATRPTEELLYDGWLIRFASDDVKRARSVNVIGPSRLELEEKLDHVEMAHLGHGQPPLYRLTSLEPAELDNALAARNYRSFDESLVQTLELATPITVPEAAPSLEAVDAARFVRELGTLRGSSVTAQAAHLRRLTSSPLPQFRVLAWQGESLVGAAMLMREDPWAVLSDVYVTPAFRRQGVATSICAYLLEQARLWGSERAWLAVEASNQAAIDLYQALGFRTAYRYWYREAEALA